MLNDLDPIWVDTRDGVEAAAAASKAAGWLALDTEADSLHSYFHKVCLIQLTANGGNFVIDPLALEPGDLAPLWELVEDPSVPVLMHGSDYDIRVLDRDYDTRIRGLVDTQIMAQILGEEKTGLAALMEKEGGVLLDKRHQRADWGLRPLTESQVVYAAADTAFLERLAVKLRERLQTLGRWDWAEEEFRKLEGVRYREPELNPLAFERVKGLRALRGGARDRAYTLFHWREEEAQRLDVPPFKVLGNTTLLELSDQPPTTPAELGKVRGIGPRFIRRWGGDVLLNLAKPSHAPEWTRSPRPPELSAKINRRMKRLAVVRDEIATELGLEPGLVCAKSCALAVASREPRCSSADDLMDSGLTGWRLDLLGSRFITALADE
ncbi:MAG: ribonuclease D [Candidatus Aminicenantes bacterium]|nr:MAG: ribonuclease D [Candidatus Aminicenantes bacterium]